jgi:hypothetical protein
MITYYVMPLILGVFFAILGAAIYYKGSGFSRKMGVIAFVVGAAVVFDILCLSPSTAHRQEMINHIIKANPVEVLRLEIEPCSDRGDSSGSRAPRVVTSQPEIERIMAALSIAAPWSPNHPVRQSCFHIRLVEATNHYDFLVIQTIDSENGTIIEIWSNIYDGFVIGIFRSDGLQAILESVMKEGSMADTKK